MQRICYTEFSYATVVENGWGLVQSAENVTFPAVKLLIWKYLGRGVHWPFCVLSDETLVLQRASFLPFKYSFHTEFMPLACRPNFSTAGTLMASCCHQLIVQFSPF